MDITAKDVKILQAIYLLDSPTRNEIALRAGFSTVSVTGILNRLLEEGAIEKSGKSRSRSGRPSALYRLDPRFGCSVGISLDTASFRIVAVDSSRCLLEKRERMLSLSANPADHLGEIMGQVSAELESFLGSGTVSSRRVLCLGITPPGMVDTERGVWLHGLQVSGISHIDLGSILREKVRVPVVVEDQARCLALLEGTRDARRDSQPLLFLLLGSGVGAGILAGGELYLGSRGLAGEIGHLIVEEEGERCSCGNVGCLETVVSEPSILKRFTKRLDEGVISSLQRFHGPGGQGLTLARIRDAALADDRLARSTLFEIGTYLGEACAKLVTLYNPRTLAIGGPAGMLGEFFRDPITLRIRHRVIPEMLVDLSIEFVSTDAFDDALGAALIAERHFWRTAEAGMFA
jgi:predicted NBD/HSP70 family sugar kinase